MPHYYKVSFLSVCCNLTPQYINSMIRHFVSDAILDYNFFSTVYCVLLVKLIHLIPILRGLKKSNPSFCGGGHLGFGMFSWCTLYSTSQALSFDTHIDRVEKIYVIRHFVAAAILDLQWYWIYIIVLSSELKVCKKFQINRSTGRA